VSFVGNTLSGQKVCDVCSEHIKRGSKTCLRRLLPYLDRTNPQLIPALMALQELVPLEPNYEVLTTIQLPEVILSLMHQIPVESTIELTHTLRLISLLATLGILPSDQNTSSLVADKLYSALSNASTPTSLKLVVAQSSAALAIDPRFVSVLATHPQLPSALMKLLSTSEDEILQAATSTLAPIVKYGTKLTTDDTERLTNSLVTTSQGVLATDPAKAARSKETLRSILTILATLTADRPHQEAVYVSGGVQVLLQISQLDQSVPTMAPIFEILSNVSKIPETIVAILHHNGLTVLLELLSSLPEIQKSVLEGPKGRTEAEKQLSKLTKRMISLLLKLVHHSDENFEDRERVISAVILPSTLAAFSSLLLSERIGKARYAIVDLLLLAIISEESRTAASKAGILMNLVQLMATSLAQAQGRQDRSSTQRLPRIVMLLTALVKGHEGNAAALVDCGVLALYLDILEPKSTSPLTVALAGLLAAISAFPASHGFITASIEQVVPLVSSSEPEIVEQGLIILANLSAVPESRAIILSDSTVNTVLPLMGSPKPGIQLQAAKFLSGISQDPRASSDMFSSVLKPLTIQLASQLTPVRHTAVTTLLDLLRSSQPKGGVDSASGIKTMLAKADGAVSSIANIMASCKPSHPTHPEADLKRACAELLALLSGNPTGRAVIVSTQQAIQMILQSLFSPDDQIVMWSVIGIASLLRQQDNQIAEAIRTSGGLMVLVRLLESPQTSQLLHNATISAIALLFGYPACRQVLIEGGVMRRLLQTIFDATKKLQEGQQLDATARTRVFTAIAALQQLIQSATDIAQAISKDATSIKSLADSIVVLAPKFDSRGTNSPAADSDLSEQLVYLALLICNAHAEAWAILVRAGGLNILLAFASSSNLSAKRSSLVELSKLSLDISFRKIIFDGEGLVTAMHIVENIPDFGTIISAAPTETNAPSSPSSLGLQVLEKALEVVTNVCEDAPALASLLQQNGASRFAVLISRFVDLSPDIVQSKMVISIAYNMVRILLQMLMFHKPPNGQVLIPCLPSLLRLVAFDIAHASYQSLQLTKIVCDTLVKLMEDSMALQVLHQLKAPQVFLNLLVRYRPSLQSPNIAEVAVNALNRLIGSTDAPLANLGLVIAPADMESLFSYLKHPIVLQVVFALASEKRSAFRSSLDKASIQKLLPHLHTLLTSTSVSQGGSIDPITFVTMLFQVNASQAPSFSNLDDFGMIGLVYSLVSYLDPKRQSSVPIDQSSLASSNGGKILLNGLSLLSHMAKRPCVHRPMVAPVGANSDAELSDSSGLEAVLGNLRASALIKAESKDFSRRDSPRLALLQFIFSLTSLYFPDIPLDLADVSPTTTVQEPAPAKPSLIDFFGESKAESSSSTTSATANAKTTSPTSTTIVNSSVSASSSSSAPQNDPIKYPFAPVELMHLSELLVSLLAALSKSASIHHILIQSGILATVSNTFKLYHQIETDVASNSSDLSLAAKQDVISRQMPCALSIIENITSNTSNTSYNFSIAQTGILFEILALGVPRPIMTAILEVLKVLTANEAAVSHVLAADGLMSLIGLLSNDNNHITSLSLAILCNLARFDELQTTLSSLIDGSLLTELSDRLHDSELSFQLTKLKEFLGHADY
jgi:hypothetical protein